MSGHVKCEYGDGVSIITISNPSKLNALTLKMFQQLDICLAQIDAETRCIVVQGDGGSAFVAGMDISEVDSKDDICEAMSLFERAAGKALDRLCAMPQPTVAKIEGFCFGAGINVALCCDLRVAADNALFSIPAARLGIGYDIAGIEKLLTAVGASFATEMLLTARRYGANEALAAGLVNRVFAHDDFERESAAYIAQVGVGAPLSQSAAKHTIRELSKRAQRADLESCQQLIDRCRGSADYLEGRRAFLEKRKPIFKGI